MRTISMPIKGVFLAAALALALPAAAADAPASTAGAAGRAMKEAAQGKGTINRVDAAAGVVTMHHEAIPALRWPAMTMDFKVTDKKLLAGLKPGQAVNFALVQQASGSYAISRLSPAK